MEAILLPQNVTAEELGANHARIIVEPCFPGYGTTLGNALRRVLLSSLPGAAVTAIKIEGVSHEFSTLPGMKEDIVDFLLNVKQIRLKSYSAEPVVINLKVSGESKVTARDIKATSDVEILNKDLHLATLTDKKAKLEVEFTVEQGRGYVAVESRDREKLPIGTIAVDAIYTPLKRVGYSVENVRVGQMTNFDKLTLDVETDGSLTPLEAVEQASQILINHFNIISGKKEEVVEDAKLADETDEIETKNDVETVAGEDKPSIKKRGRPKKEVNE